ncbi:hypothetical protein J4Q44_G00060780, partial [Coregonus suidteri]
DDISRVAQWSKATRDPGSNLGSVVAGRDRETHGVAHNWPSVVQCRGGNGRQDVAQLVEHGVCNTSYAYGVEDMTVEEAYELGRRGITHAQRRLLWRSGQPVPHAGGRLDKGV